MTNDSYEENTLKMEAEADHEAPAAAAAAGGGGGGTCSVFFYF